MDGVLFDTEQLVRDSYADVGVEMPEGAFGKRWDQWLPQTLDSRSACDDIRFRKSNAMHARATADYMRSIALPPLDLLLDNLQTSTIATNASIHSAYINLMNLMDNAVRYVSYAVDLNDHLHRDKLDFLMKSAGAAVGKRAPHIYIDDSLEFVDIVNAEVAREFVNRPLIAIHYSGQTRTELEELIIHA